MLSVAHNMSRETSYSYQVAYVKSIPSSSPKVEASSLAVIATALKLHSVFNFDALLKIGSVRVVKDHPLFFLLKIMLEGGIPEYQSWLAANEAVLNEFGRSFDILVFQPCNDIFLPRS